MSAAVRGGWKTPPFSVRLGNLIQGAQLANRAEAEKFAIACAKPLKAEAMKAVAKVYGPDLRPFKDKKVKARAYDEIEYAPPTATGGGFKLHIFLKPGEIWAVGEWGTYDHLIGMPKGSSGAKAKRSNSNLSAFGQLQQAAKVKKKKQTPVFIKAPGYAHPVRGPIVVRGMPPRGLIKYAFKLMRSAQGEVVSREWDRYISAQVRKEIG